MCKLFLKKDKAHDMDVNSVQWSYSVKLVFLEFIILSYSPSLKNMSHDKNLVGGSGFGLCPFKWGIICLDLYFQVDISILMFLIGTSSAELTAISIWVLACRPLVHFIVFCGKREQQMHHIKRIHPESDHWIDHIIHNVKRWTKKPCTDALDRAQ